MRVSNPSDWDRYFAKYICIATLLVGIGVFLLVGLFLILYTLLHVSELWGQKTRLMLKSDWTVTRKSLIPLHTKLLS